ncbi:MAG TPA: prolipoprotein diacylglyceryl transferase [Polyangia bacterium]
MSPTLFALRLGPRSLDIHSYGLLVALGAIAGILLAVRQGKRMGFDIPAVLDLCFWALVAGIVGSRLLYVIVHIGGYSNLCFSPSAPRPALRALADCAAPLAVWQGGLVFYGGAIAAAAVVLAFARRRAWRLGDVADLLAPSLALGHVFGRVGCFLAGCCYGKLCSLGVYFPPASVAYTELSRQGQISSGASFTPALAPTQLYEAAGEGLLFVWLLFLRGRRRPFSGSLALVYAMGYALLRGSVEVFRGDTARGFLFEWPSPRLATWLGLPMDQALAFSTAQAFSLILGAGAGAAYWLLRRRSAAL